jgi:hypothetical protein
MRWIVTDPRGVEAALADPCPDAASKHPINRYLAPSPDCLGCIAGDESYPAAARLSVYAEAYFLRIVESMERDFRRTSSLLGADGFARLIAEYLKFYPSQSWNINEVGKDLATFVNDSPEMLRKILEDVVPDNCMSRDSQQSWIGLVCELIQLEWVGLRSFFSAVVNDQVVELVDGSVESDAAEIFVTLNPGLVLMKSMWPLSEMWCLEDWSTAQSGRFDPDIFVKSVEPRVFGIWRGAGDGFRLANVSAVEFSPAEAALAECFLNGLSLEKALESVESEFETEDQVSALFAHWTRLGIIVAVGTDAE